MRTDGGRRSRPGRDGEDEGDARGEDRDGTGTGRDDGDGADDTGEESRRDETGRGKRDPAAAHATAVADELASYDRVIEVGIGRRTDVARRLVDRGVTVVAVDRRSVETPEGVQFVRDDIVRPSADVYDAAGALYALNLPPELHRAVADLAREVGADLAFTTLGGDPPTVHTRPETVVGGTLHWVRER